MPQQLTLHGGGGGEAPLRWVADPARQPQQLDAWIEAVEALHQVRAAVGPAATLCIDVRSVCSSSGCWVPTFASCHRCRLTRLPKRWRRRRQTWRRSCRSGPPRCRPTSTAARCQTRARWVQRDRGSSRWAAAARTSPMRR